MNKTPLALLLALVVSQTVQADWRAYLGPRTLNCGITDCTSALRCIRDLKRQISRFDGKACTYLREVSKPSPAEKRDALARAPFTPVPDDANLTTRATEVRSLYMDLRASIKQARRLCGE